MTTGSANDVAQHTLRLEMAINRFGLPKVVTAVVFDTCKPLLDLGYIAPLRLCGQCTFYYS